MLPALGRGPEAGLFYTGPLRMPHSIDRPWVWASLSIALVLGWQSLTVQANYGGNWTGLFRTGSTQAVPDNLLADTFRNAHPRGYDGQFYRFLAHDPFLRNGTDAYLDSPALRARRVLAPLLAWIVAGGRPAAIDGAYILLIAACIFAGVYGVGRIMARQGRSPAWGLSFLAVPAALVGIDTMTVDILLATLIVCFAWQVQTGRRRWLWLTVAAAPLVRETGLVLAAACTVDTLVRRDWRNAGFWMTATIPFLLWSLYLLTLFPRTAMTAQTTFPVWYYPRLPPGIVSAFLFQEAYANLPAAVGSLVRVLDRACLLAVLIAAVLGLLQLRAERWRETTLAMCAFAGFVPLLGRPGIWLPVYGYSRLMSPLFLLLLIAYSPKSTGRALAGVLLICLTVDLRVAAEMWTQFLGVVHWLGA